MSTLSVDPRGFAYPHQSVTLTQGYCQCPLVCWATGYSGYCWPNIAQRARSLTKASQTHRKIVCLALKIAKGLLWKPTAFNIDFSSLYPFLVCPPPRYFSMKISPFYMYFSSSVYFARGWKLFIQTVGLRTTWKEKRRHYVYWSDCNIPASNPHLNRICSTFSRYTTYVTSHGRTSRMSYK